MCNPIGRWLVIFGIVIGVAVVPSLVGVANMANALDIKGTVAGGSQSVASSEQTSHSSATGIVRSIINILLYAVGAASVIAIILAGLAFITSNGNPESIRKARATLVAAIIGLAVAIMAFGIVNYVFSRFDSSPAAVLKRAQEEAAASSSQLQGARKGVRDAQTAVDRGQTSVNNAQTAVDKARSDKRAAQQKYDAVANDTDLSKKAAAKAVLDTATTVQSNAETNLQEAQNQLKQARRNLVAAQNNERDAETREQKAQKGVDSAKKDGK